MRSEERYIDAEVYTDASKLDWHLPGPSGMFSRT